MTVVDKSTRLRVTQLMLAFCLMLILPVVAIAHPPDDDHGHHPGDQPGSGGEHGSLAEIGKKLSNPMSNVWALFTEFDLSFNNGNANQGDDKIGSLMNFQPIMPFPLYGEGDDQWKMIVRPAIPIQFAAPRPDGVNNTNYDAGIADITLPFFFTPPAPHLIVGLGPAFVLPTSSKVQFGRRQWQAGAGGILGYKNEDLTIGLNPEYFWGVGGRGDQGSNIENASHMALLYFVFINLPNAWQVGANPVITYDHKASRGNKWNVPVGLLIAKTTKVGKMPVKFQFGAEYSVVSQDDFGKRFLLKLNITPVIQGLVKNPIFGGGG
jgi:hypothetical protein